MPSLHRGEDRKDFSDEALLTARLLLSTYAGSAHMYKLIQSERVCLKVLTE